MLIRTHINLVLKALGIITAFLVVYSVNHSQPLLIEDALANDAAHYVSTTPSTSLYDFTMNDIDGNPTFPQPI